MPANRSLKDKRQIVKSVLALIQNKFSIAAAEVERQEQWQIGVLGLACVSVDSGHADEVLSKAISFIGSTRLDAEIVDVHTEILHL